MATISRFEEIKAWQKARFFCQQIFEICNETDLSKEFKLRGQVMSSSGSVMDNIAEEVIRNSYSFLK